jgi:glycosyltransferase involved in cell wall biosynthesis
MIVEGAYPFVVGGVSTWVHDLLTSYKDITFSLVHIGVSSEYEEDIKYELPPNVLEFRKIHLLDNVPWRGPRFKNKAAAWKSFETFVDDIVSDDITSIRDVLAFFSKENPDSLSPYDIFHGKPFWDLLVKHYEEHMPDFSFIDYFWTVRFMALPLFRVIYADLPDSSIYHAACTGYAGLLGAIASIRKGRPFIITEHGIYTNERMIEITQAHWIYKEKRSSIVPTRQLGALQGMWMKKFDLLSRIAYDQATALYTLYEGNRLLQIQGGAAPEKTNIIANGIDLERFEDLSIAHRNKKEENPRVCMVGRVAPIKDVKTFIRAAKIVAEQMPEVRFQILGGADEDEGYFGECERLVRILSLQDVFEFTGTVDMKEYYPGISCIVLTSISEAQPFVLLEAMRIGIPVVASSVGACAEIVYGVSPEDQSIGPSGAITNVRSSQETAEAIMDILRNPEKARAMGEAGRERVGRYYIREKMLSDYHDVYRRYCGGGA